MFDTSDNSFVGDHTINSDFNETHISSEQDIQNDLYLGGQGTANGLGDATENGDSDPTSKDKNPKLSKELKTIISNANSLLTSLEEEHRHDLAIHLYSSYLLRKLLYQAHEKKHFQEVDIFIRTQIREGWASWPNPNTTIDPQLDRVYEDNFMAERRVDVSDEMRNEIDAFDKKEYRKISDYSMKHARNMLRMELNSHWQHRLQQAACKTGKTLDVNSIDIPTDISNEIMNKLDHLLAGLNTKIAKINKFDVKQSDSEKKLTLIQKDIGQLKSNRHIEFDYHDIISRGCEMGIDMRNIYMKSLELYNDIPSKFDKSQFKIPKQILAKYKPAAADPSKDKFNEIVSRMKDDYVLFDNLISDKRLTSTSKLPWKKLYKKEKDLLLAKKVFFYVKGYQEEESSEDEYSAEDCIVKIPRRH